MATYNFTVNSRLSAGVSSSSNTTVSNSVVRVTPPPPTVAGRLVTMHPMMGAARPMLLSHQGFPITANHQIFTDRMFSTAPTIPPLMPAALNDAPLDFNVLPSKSYENTELHKARRSTLDASEKMNIIQSREMIRDSSDKDNDKDERTANYVPVPNQTLPAMSNPPSIWNNLVNNVNFPLLGMNQMIQPNIIDPSLFVGQSHFNLFNNNVAVPSVPVVNNLPSDQTGSVIHHKNCSLVPPHTDAPIPTTRDRPQGCKTVFVGGLPDNVTEDLIREIFTFCGEIINIRLSSKKFCHIRFLDESSVDKALTLSGYRIVLPESAEQSSGRLHVDFAHARDDQYEWECKQRQIRREQRHRERIIQDSCRDLSPSGPIYYTDREANSLLEKLKGEDSYLKAISVAVSWLDRGECNKGNVNMFYSMIQSINSHIRRLLIEKNLCEAEYNKIKESLKAKSAAILTQAYKQQNSEVNLKI